MSLINAGALLDCVLSAYYVMVRVAVHRMDFERAHTLLELAENHGNTRGWGRLSAGAVLADWALVVARVVSASGCPVVEVRDVVLWKVFCRIA